MNKPQYKRSGRMLLPAASVLIIATSQISGFAAESPANKLAEMHPIITEQHFGLPKLVARIQEIQANPASSESQKLSSMNDLLLRLLQLSAQIRVVSNRIDREVADADQRRAILAERRDRAVRINTYADLISGGITGVVGGGLKLKDVNHIGPDIIDTVEGGVQTSLSTWALQQQRGEQRIERTQPGLLAAIIDPSKRLVSDYPDDIWQYLNTKQASGLSLREQLSNRWSRYGFCLRHSGHRTAGRERMQHMALLHPSNRVSIDLLEDRIAMLYDLRATVTGVDDELLQALTMVQTAKTAQ